MKFISCVAIFLLILFSFSNRSTANDSLPTANDSLPTAKTIVPSLQGNSFALPKDVNTLRQMLIDTNRKIEDSEKGIKATEIAISLVEEWEHHANQVKYDPEVLLSSIKNSLTTGDYSRLQSQIGELYMDFFGRYGGPRISDQELVLGSSGRKTYNLLKERISQITAKYQKNIELLPSNIPQPFFSESDEDWNKPGFKLTQADVDAIKSVFSTSNKSSYDSELKVEISKAIVELNKILEKQQAELNRFLQLRGAITAAEAKAKGEINELAIRLGLPLFCITIIVLFVISFLGRRTKKDSDNSDFNLPDSFNFSTLVEISTVLLLTMSILILGLADKLEPAVLGTLLGGISGYVLNRSKSRDGTADAQGRGKEQST